VDNRIQYLYQRAKLAHQAGELGEAECIYREILDIQPHFFDAIRLLGVVHAQQGRYLEARELTAQALTINPASLEALTNQGDILRALNLFEQALEYYDRALIITPSDPDLLIVRALALQTMQRFDEALTSYSKAISLGPAHFEALNNRGVIHMKRGHYGDAVRDFSEALTLRPGSIDTLNNQGKALRELNRLSEALEVYDSALRLAPADWQLLNDRGLVLAALGRTDEAVTSFSDAHCSNQKDANILYNRANSFCAMGLFDSAAADYENAITLDRNHHHAFDGMANVALLTCDWKRVKKIEGEMAGQFIQRDFRVQPGVLLGYCDDPELLLQAAKCHTTKKTNHVGPQALNTKQAEIRSSSKIRIAYLSPDFNQHATTYLINELIELHDRKTFDVIGLSFGKDDSSEMRRRVVSAFDQFYDVAGYSDYEVAQLLRSQNISIAIDLNGHMRNSRSRILSYRPCPIQINYLGYPGTMGADFIDYIIADRVVAPFEHQSYFTEAIVHLPNCYQVNDSRRSVPKKGLTRSHVSLPENAFVFCCFNNSWKITAPMFEVWMRLLKNVPHSVLWLLSDNKWARANLSEEAASRGVDSRRLIFAERLAPEDHLARHRLADLFLDTLPYNGHTTASDALRMGLPLVTCLGKSFQGRVAASLLNAAGMEELMTSNLTDYEALALQLARDGELLARVRAKLDDVMKTPLFDTRAFCHDIEAAYLRMYDLWRMGRRSKNFLVPRSATS